MTRPVRTLTGAVVLALALLHAAPADAQRAGRLSVGFGFSGGTYRHGPTLSAKVFVHDRVALAAQVSSGVYTLSRGFSADVYTESGSDTYVTLGVVEYDQYSERPRPKTYMLNLGAGRDFRSRSFFGTSLAGGAAFAQYVNGLKVRWFLDPALSFNLHRPGGEEEEAGS